MGLKLTEEKGRKVRVDGNMETRVGVCGGGCE